MRYGSLFLLFGVINLWCIGPVLGIIGGDAISGTFNPFFVKIKSPENVCGGTLIAADVVLTAAHCLTYQARKRWALPGEIRVFKNTDLHWKTEPIRYSCKRYIYHESFDIAENNGFPQFDIAVIKLKRCVDTRLPWNGILKLCPPGSSYSQGSAVGLGLKRTIPRSKVADEVLMAARLQKYWPCAFHFYSEYGIDIDEEKQVCYGSLKPSQPAGPCYGDYGGPIVLENPASEIAVCLIGVASFNFFSCETPMHPTVYTSATYFATWIEESISALAADTQCYIL